MQPPQDERHALYIGWVVGHAMRAGVTLEPRAIGNDYSDTWDVQLPWLPDGYTVAIVVPPPPDGWDFTVP